MKKQVKNSVPFIFTPKKMKIHYVLKHKETCTGLVF